MAAVLMTYRGIVRNGKIELEDALLPEGAKVVVVAQEKEPSLEEQKKRLAAIPQAEWEARRDAYDQFLREHPADENIDTLSDEEIVALVHEVRAEYRAGK
ncbi:MAG: hypothetical protein HF973_01650 [Chloroflexi bacterium]|nr:hypothetical protein [Chloroflexota bacterium]